MKHDDGAAARIVEQLEQSGLETVMLDGVRPVEAAIRYFRARLPRMDYAAARRQDLPIGSGAMAKNTAGLRPGHENHTRSEWAGVWIQSQADAGDRRRAVTL